MIFDLSYTRQERLRWIVSGFIVVTAHCVLAAAILNWATADDSSDPIGAFVIELAPMPVAPNSEQSNLPPGPEQVQSEASPERLAKPTEKVVEKTVEPDPVKEAQQDIPDKQNPEIALQKKTPEPEPEKPQPSEAQLAAPATTAPQMARTETAPVAAAPMQTQFNLVDSNAIPTWKRRVVGKLERNKRYPSAAHARDEKGVVHLEFSVDRQGHLRSSRIIQGSGSDALDRETLELVKRAQPFGPPPETMTGEEIFLVVPIRYTIH